ncbi:MAG: diacylglycerol kinase [Spirochaetaceae bacterium]|jgi:diacylglycerol kinase family enzyme|nr:diacylglycerol kinase [Spirochaetaceae bacterium]
MSSKAHIETFTGVLAEICAHALTAPERPLRWLIAANPKAGGFTIGSRWKRHTEALSRSLQKAGRNPRRDAEPMPGAGAQGLILAGSAGAARRTIENLLNASVQASDPPFHLIITAGGDGTSREALHALYSAPPAARSCSAILRLPLGTGNDGADAWEVDQALDLLLEPGSVQYSRAVRLTAATGKGPFYAFNILSLGLDAFVTHMTNKMKGRFPGDSYKLWVDIAALLYDRLYRVGPVSVKAFDGQGNPVASFRETLLLLAVGASGNRTYGSRKRILPDERNVCALKQMPLFRKLALKELFKTGTHIDKPEAVLFNASRIEVQGAYPLLAQMDGETAALQPEDFPAVIELTEPVIPVLAKAMP